MAKQSGGTRSVNSGNAASTRSRRGDLKAGEMYSGKFDGDTVEYEIVEKRGGGYQLISYTWSGDNVDRNGNPKPYRDIQEETDTLEEMKKRIKKERYFKF